MKKVILLIAILSLCFKFSYSQSGQLDPSFGINGIVKTDIGFKVTNGSNIRDLLLQSDGSFYVFFEKNEEQNFITKNLSDGSIDSSYGGDGFSSPLYFLPNDVVLQPDGKIVLVGEVNGDFAVARFNIHGKPDSTFSNEGLITTDFNSSYDLAARAAIQSDGKIVVLGFATINDNLYYALVRYNIDGSLDSSFSNNGKQNTSFPPYFTDGYGAIAIQDDGKIVVAGNTAAITNTPDFVVARFNTDGSTDSSFSEDGKQMTDFDSWYEQATSVAIQSDEKIVVAGTVNINSNDFALARYNTDGSPDNTFDEDGKLITDFPGFQNNEPSSLAIQSDGKIIAGGFAEKEGRLSDFALARYNTNGSLDKSFSGDGLQTTDFDSQNDIANLVAIQSDGKIVAAGRSSSSSGGGFSIARYNTNGSLDNTFDDDGKLTHSLSFKEGHTKYTRAAIQRDGKIVAAGYTQKEDYNQQPIFVRYNTNGSLDSSFSSDGMQTTDLSITAIAIQKDGKIVVASGKNEEESFNFTVSRYNSDGNLDSSFSDDGKQASDISITSLAIQKDGKIVIAGEKYNELENTDFSLAQYNNDGTLDSSFSVDGKLNIDFGNYETANSVAIQGDGKIVIAGTLYYNSLGNIGVARLNNDGTLDKSFSNDGTQTTFISGNNTVSSIAVGNGKIAVGGIINSQENLSSFIALYNSDGSLDTGFSEDGKQLTDFGQGGSSVAIQTDGKIVVCNSSSNSINPVSIIARYNTNGNLDSSFSKDGIIQTPGLNAKSIVFDNNKLYAVGSGDNGPFGGGIFGAVARYIIDGNPNKPPTVSITIPYNIVKYTAPARIKLNAAATDEDGEITKVEFYNGTTLLHTETVFPYNYLGTDVPIGTYSFTAKAIDDSGNIATSNIINVSVVDENVPPVVSIVSPVNDTTYHGPSTIRLIAQAKDPNDKLSKVEFYNGTTLITTEYYYPYTYDWNVQAGTYTITAKAYDDKGLSTTSDTVTVTVKAEVTVNITPDKDNTIYSGSPEYSNGSGGFIVSGKRGGDGGNSIQRALLHFDLSSIPAGSKIDSATLTLHVGRLAPVRTGVALHKLTANWGEGASVAGGYGQFGVPAEEGDATWNHAFFPGTSWTTPGGDFKPAATAITDNVGGGVLVIPNLATDVESWLNDSSANFGWIIKATDDSIGQSVKTFYSRNHLAESYRPSLSITYTPMANKAPTVSITKPSNNETIAGPSTIRLRAAAKDPDGTISKVEFYNGTTLLRTETDSPYTYTWIDVPVGNYAVTAKATDNWGVVTTSAVVNISVVPNKAPTVSIINPADNKSFTDPATIPLIASAKDPDGTISRVEFYNGTTLLNIQFISPYTHTMRDIPAGTYTITAKAIDNLGLSIISAPITITVTSSNTIVRSKPSSVNNKTDMKEAVSLNVYPNPASSTLNIYTKGLQQNKQTFISVISSSGVVMKTMQSNSSTQTVQLDVSSLVRGVYTIKLLYGERVLYKQFVKL